MTRQIVDQRIAAADQRPSRSPRTRFPMGAKADWPDGLLNFSQSRASRRTEPEPRPGVTDLTTPQILSFALVTGAIATFAWGRFRYDLVSLVALLIGVAIGIVPRC